MTTVRVEVPARLHLGMFDLTGSLGRRFGGIGAAISHPAVVIEATLGTELAAEGPEAARVLEFARRYLLATGTPGGAHLRVVTAIPNHVGLGSGTKLALAVARALAELHGHPADPQVLALAVGRAQRSAIGLWTFGQGGIVVEGGRREGGGPAPLLARYEAPRSWRVVLAIPSGSRGLHGAAEVAAFERLSPPAATAAAISHLVLMALLPALVEGELAEFGRALTAVQQLVGQSFGPAQGGTFANAAVARLVAGLLDAGAAGAGQSSWGPAVYALAAGDAEAARLAGVARAMLEGNGAVEVVTFDSAGAQVRLIE